MWGGLLDLFGREIIYPPEGKFVGFADCYRVEYKLYRKGILMNILNPKVLLFFIAFFPQFVSPATENPAGELLILGLLFMAQAIVIFTLVALLADRLSHRLMQNARFSLIMHIIESLVYFAIGISLIFVTV